MHIDLMPVNSAHDFYVVAIILICDSQSAYNLLQYEISSSIFPSTVKNSSKSYVIEHLWRFNPKIVLRGFMEMYSVDPESMGRIVDVCQELKVRTDC